MAEKNIQSSNTSYRRVCIRFEYVRLRISATLCALEKYLKSCQHIQIICYILCLRLVDTEHRFFSFSF